MTNITAEQIFGSEILKKANKLYRTCSKGTFAKTACETLIKPNIQQIEHNCKQPMDPMYCAYLLEFVIMKATNCD